MFLYIGLLSNINVVYVYSSDNGFFAALVLEWEISKSCERKYQIRILRARGINIILSLNFMHCFINIIIYFLYGWCVIVSIYIT